MTLTLILYSPSVWVLSHLTAEILVCLIVANCSPHQGCYLVCWRAEAGARWRCHQGFHQQEDFIQSCLLNASSTPHPIKGRSLKQAEKPVEILAQEYPVGRSVFLSRWVSRTKRKLTVFLLMFCACLCGYNHCGETPSCKNMGLIQALGVVCLSVGCGPPKVGRPDQVEIVVLAGERIRWRRTKLIEVYRIHLKAAGSSKERLLVMGSGLGAVFKEGRWGGMVT